MPLSSTACQQKKNLYEQKKSIFNEYATKRTNFDKAAYKLSGQIWAKLKNTQYSGNYEKLKKYAYASEVPITQDAFIFMKGRIKISESEVDQRFKNWYITKEEDALKLSTAHCGSNQKCWKQNQQLTKSYFMNFYKYVFYSQLSKVALFEMGVAKGDHNQLCNPKIK